jgi:hypothetical protein
VEVASVELQACFVRIILVCSKFQLFYFLVSCIGLNYYIPFTGWPRDIDFSHTVDECAPLFFISFFGIECHFFWREFGQFFPIKRLFYFWRAIPQNSMVAQPAPINTNPFGTLHALPQMSIGRVGNTPSVQYGISSMPVNDVSWF